MEYFKLLPAPVQCAVSTALFVTRKHKPALRRHPQYFFQAILNEGGNEYASKALQILQTRYPYIEILNKKDNSKQRRVKARFKCDSLVACFDVSRQMEYMVCECVDRSIQLWSLQSLYKVDNLNSELLCEIASPGICGLIHFHPDGQKLVCGYIDPEWHSRIEITCLNYKLNDTGEHVCDISEPDLSWWPWEFKFLDEARYDDLVVTWHSFDQSAREHVLHATTGDTLHKLLTGQSIDGCKFLNDGKHLVCCGYDGSNVPLCNIFNANSDELITFIATHPHAQLSTLTSSLNKPLFAVGIDFPDYKLYRAHYPEVRGSKRKEKRIKLQF
ncbi:hypothetical protein ACROYT_G030986 [Oculina patagonica]